MQTLKSPYIDAFKKESVLKNVLKKLLKCVLKQIVKK
jgi:hypothetical protein